MADYNKITTAEFDHVLANILDKLSGEQVMGVPGVYEIVSEHFNNEALDLAMEMFHADEEVDEPIEPEDDR